MKLLDTTSIKPDEVYGTSGLDRSDGLHQSDVIDYIMTNQGVSYSDSDWDRSSMFEAGFTWEEVFEDAFKRRREPVIRPDEISLDGITGSPDGYNWRNGELYEYKWTWKSQNSFAILEQYRWHMQVKGYMKMLSSENRKVTVVNWFVFFANGDYRGSGPRAVQYRVEFSPREIDENWHMFLMAKKDMEEASE